MKQLVLIAALLVSTRAQAQTCDTTLNVPKGFCATVFADSIPGARHIVVAPNGDVFVAANNSRNGKGGVFALRDTTHDGRADMRVKFGENGGSGIALRGENLYFSTTDAVLRYHLPAGNLLAHTTVDTIVRNMPTGGHGARSLALGKGNDLFVNVGSRTNSCQVADRAPESPGNDPCTELETRAGIWRFDATKTNQTQADVKKYATGLRNVVALTFGIDGVPYGVQHGRDQLSSSWPKYFTNEESAEKPAEIFVRILEHDDYGWPYCFYDREQGKHMLAPEYGGDGKQTGRCTNTKQPLLAFPGHWAPDGVTFYQGRQFPQHYTNGAFIAFHGSWNRAPLPQAGFKVVFVPFINGKPSGHYEVFADGFAGPNGQIPATGAAHRPVGLAVAPDGALYIGDDTGGRIWRVTYSPMH